MPRDPAPEPGMTVTTRLFEIQNNTIFYFKERIIYTELTLIIIIYSPLSILNSKQANPIFCVITFGYNLPFIYIQVRLSVIVMPHADAASCVCK